MINRNVRTAFTCTKTLQQLQQQILDQFKYIVPVEDDPHRYTVKPGTFAHIIDTLWNMKLELDVLEEALAWELDKKPE
jgi:hypothetical protein